MFIVPSAWLAYERLADAPSIDEHDPELAPVAVLVTLDRLQADRAAFEKLVEPHGRTVAEFLFLRTPVIVRLRSVDVGDPDLHALQPDRVAVDDAIVSAADVAIAKADARAGYGGLRLICRAGALQPGSAVKRAQQRYPAQKRKESQPTAAPPPCHLLRPHPLGVEMTVPAVLNRKPPDVRGHHAFVHQPLRMPLESRRSERFTAGDRVS